MKTKIVNASMLIEDDVWISASGSMYELAGVKRVGDCIHTGGHELGRVRIGRQRGDVSAVFGLDEKVRILMTEER